MIARPRLNRSIDLDEPQMTKWIRQAAALPGWGKTA
jgi:hypothetical protein